MSEIKNKLVYLDVYSTSPNITPNIMDNAVSVLRNVQDCFSGFGSIHFSFWQNSMESDSLDTATLLITKDGFDSYYFITATTSDRTDGKCTLKLELICKNGKTIQLWNNSYDANVWSSHLFRVFYMSTSKIFLFSIYITNSATPSTVPIPSNTNNNTGILCYVKDKNNNSFYVRGATIYKDDGTYTSISQPAVKNNDVDKVTLGNIYVNSYALDGLYTLTTASSSSVNNNYYCELKEYGKYYAYDNNTSSHKSIAIKLDDESIVQLNKEE